MTNNAFEARGIYNFKAEGPNELSFHADDILTITSTAAGHGWWYAKNSAGQIGVIPENHVQVVDDTPEATESPPTINNNYTNLDTLDSSSNPAPTSSQTNYWVEIEEQQQYINSTPADNWLTLEPNQSNEQEVTNPFNSILSSTNDENLLNALPITSSALDPYAMVIDASPTSPRAPTSFSNPLVTMNTINGEQTGWYVDSTAPAPVFQSSFDQTNNPFGLPQTQSTLFDDYIMSNASQQSVAPSSDSIYDSPLTYLSKPMESTPIQPISNASQSPTKDQNSTLPPPLPTIKATKSVPDKSPTSPTNKKSKEPKEKSKFFTLGRKAKPEGKKRRTSVESVAQEQPAPKQAIDTDSFSSQEEITATQEALTESGNQVVGTSSETKAAPRARFFDKHGIDNYLLNGSKIKSDEHVEIAYDDTEGGAYWKHNPTMPPFTCKLEEPSKGTKLGGLKAYMAYKIHAQIPGSPTVSRRYKHFDWLHKQLVTKFRFICVPPLPGKQIAGRFEQEFIDERRRQLEIWLNRICHHPVLCASFPVQHFIKCEITEKNDKDWKTGKRRIEKDELRGASWLHCVTLINTNLTDPQIAMQIESFAQQQPGLETHLRNLSQGLTRYLERHTEVYERDIQRVGELFSKVHTVIQVDTTTPGNQELANSISKISSSYNEIADSYKNKASEGIRNFNDHIQEYIGLLAGFPSVISIQRSASEFIRGVQQRGPSSTPDSSSAIHRNHVLNHVVLAEINFFQKNKVLNFNFYMKTLMDEQIKFYEKITTELRDASSTFN